MDVPFISSGALSRAHYALVRKTETAPSPQAADQLLFAEVESIRSQLARSTLTLVCQILCSTIARKLISLSETMQGMLDNPVVLLDECRY